MRVGVQGFVMLLGDLTAFALATMLGSFMVRDQGDLLGTSLSATLQQNQPDFYVLFALAWTLWFGFIKKSYTRRKPYWTDLWDLLTGVLVFAILNAALSGLSKSGFSSTLWGITWTSLLILLPCMRYACQLLLRHFKVWCIPTLIIGSGENAKEAFLALQSEPNMGLDVKAFALLPSHSDQSAASRAVSPITGIPIYLLDKSAESLRLLRPFHCVIALEAFESEIRDTAIRLLNRNKINDVHVIPSMRGVPLYGLETFNFFSHEVLLLQLRNNLANPLHRICKRAFDFFGSLTLLLLLSPVFAVLTYKVSRDGGKPFFGHVRIGQNGQSFKCYKFRSMVVNAQEVLAHLLATDAQAKAEWDQDFKLKNDPRVSQLGELMRRTSLDELPQLWNVLKGEMSLIGPRPVVQAELERYGEDLDYYLMAKPGMTGLWQVSGRNDVDYATRVYLDSWYVKNWSLWSDIAILFKTISVVIKRSGAY
jgi:Undecaprenyl-phosphate galactose phosphotransferase WbaP